MSKQSIAIIAIVLIFFSSVLAIVLYGGGHFGDSEDYVENQTVIEQDTDGDGLLDSEEVDIYGTDPKNIDSDGDYVRDDIEIEKGTDPTKVFTYGGIDDFNRIYTYNLLPYSAQKDTKFMEDLPNVEARLWDVNDGGIGFFTTEQHLEISKRDPLIQKLAINSHIEWTEDGIGTLYVDGEKLFKNGNKDFVGAEQPSFFFTHERIGSCGDVDRAARSILELLGYDTESVSFEVDIGNGEEYGHVAPEVAFNNKPYVVDFNSIVPREGFYEKRGWRIDSDYDPDWYLK